MATPSKKRASSSASNGVSGCREGATPSVASKSDENIIESFEIWDEGWYEENWLEGEW